MDPPPLVVVLDPNLAEDINKEDQKLAPVAEKKGKGGRKSPKSR